LLDAFSTRAQRRAAVTSSVTGPLLHGFNLLMDSREEAFVAYNRAAEIESSAPAVECHLLTTADVDDVLLSRDQPSVQPLRRARTARVFAAIRSGVRAELAALLDDHSTTRCAHRKAEFRLWPYLGDYATRSSSLKLWAPQSTTVESFFRFWPAVQEVVGDRAAVPFPNCGRF